MMKEWKADLHIHTCLSPCAEPEMVPTAIVRRAKTLGLDMIAICDHNSGQNVAAVSAAGQRETICVIPGMEITSSEEVHILGLFKSEQELMKLQNVVYENLPGENDEAAFGSQTIVDQWDRPAQTSTKLLIGATTLTLEQVVETIHGYNGIAVAAHVDRPSFSLISQLGFIPEKLNIDALEVSPRATSRKWDGLPVITSSDAHCLKDIGRSFNTFFAEGPTFEEIGKTLHGEEGRRVLISMEDLSLHILDIVENSIAAQADRIEILIDEDSDKDTFSLEIRDNGKGMDDETRKNAFDPFFTSRRTRKVGLGIPLLEQAAQQSGGSLEIASQCGQGTTVKAVFQLSHPDRKPLGDIAETLRTILGGYPDVDLHFRYTKNSEVISQFDTADLDDEE
jgi:predicted metal-dependent phosphoesterase TrpH